MHGSAFVEVKPTRRYTSSTTEVQFLENFEQIYVITCWRVVVIVRFEIYEM